jgi:hypothetical protein
MGILAMSADMFPDWVRDADTESEPPAVIDMALGSLVLALNRQGISEFNLLIRKGVGGVYLASISDDRQGTSYARIDGSTGDTKLLKRRIHPT